MLRLVSLFLFFVREKERDDERDGIARKLDKLLLGSSKCLSSRLIEGEGYFTLSFSDDSVKRLEINTVIFGQRRGWEGLTFASSCGQPEFNSRGRWSLVSPRRLPPLLSLSFFLPFFLSPPPRESCICGIFKDVAKKQRKRERDDNMQRKALLLPGSSNG